MGRQGGAISRSALEVERQLSRNGSRGDVMRSAEGGEEVVQHVIVGEVNEVDLSAPLVAIALEEIVGSEGKVEEAARFDALRIVIVILGSGRRDIDERLPELRRQTDRR